MSLVGNEDERRGIRVAEDAIVRLVAVHLDAYPDDVFVSEKYRMLRWKLAQLISEVREGRHWEIEE